MEQNIQQSGENKLPIKTKIAAILVIVFGGVLLVLSLKELLSLTSFLTSNYGYEISYSKTLSDKFNFIIPLIGQRFFIITIGYFLLGISCPFLGISLLKKKRWAWKITLGLLSFLAVVLFILGFTRNIFLSGTDIFTYSLPFLVFIPLVLLLADRKNFLEKQDNITQNNQFDLFIKTMIAAWMMVILGGIEFFFILDIAILNPSQDALPISFLIALVALVFALLQMISGILILKIKKSGWILGILSVILSSFVFYFDLGLFILVCFILLLLDRKNFWKVAK